ncbi:MAG: 30S ribosomal protein S6 [Candidatus Omnitrophota bacterium]
MKTLRNYEGIFILRPELSEETGKKTIADIEASITKNDGKVENTEVWGKKSLAYPIDGKKEGLYYKVDFSIEPAKVDVLTRAYKLFGDILRVQFIVK